MGSGRNYVEEFLQILGKTAPPCDYSNCRIYRIYGVQLSSGV